MFTLDMDDFRLALSPNESMESKSRRCSPSEIFINISRTTRVCIFRPVCRTVATFRRDSLSLSEHANHVRKHSRSGHKGNENSHEFELQVTSACYMYVKRKVYAHILKNATSEEKKFSVRKSRIYVGPGRLVVFLTICLNNLR